MLFVKLDTAWPDHPKIIDAGLEGAGLHAVVLCLAKRLETDGWVDRRLLRRHGATDELIDRLVTLDLLEADAGRERPDGWHDRNPSQDALERRREAGSEGGRRGNHRRWHTGTYEGCARCQAIATPDPTRSDPTATGGLSTGGYPQGGVSGMSGQNANPQVIATTDRPRSGTESPPDRPRSPESESESESEYGRPIAYAIDSPTPGSTRLPDEQIAANLAGVESLKAVCNGLRAVDSP